LLFSRRTSKIRDVNLSSIAASAVSYVGAGGVTGSIAVSLVAQTNSAAQQQIATLFSTLGLGRTIDTTA
jgi:hypothetical protein